MKQIRLLNLIVVASIVIVAVGFTPTPAVAQDGAPRFDRDTLYVPGELIVRFGGGLSRSAALESAKGVAEAFGGSVMGFNGKGTSSLMSFDENADVAVIAQQIRNVPGVVSVEPNYVHWVPEANPLGVGRSPTGIKFTAADGRTREFSLEYLKQLRSVRKTGNTTQSVPTYPAEVYDQWGWWSVEASIIWPEKVVSPGVCVIDTGVDIKHPDLVGRAINGYDFVNDDATAEDNNGHGTHVAGTIAAIMNNKKGFSGISNGKVVGVKVLAAQGFGTSWDISRGIYYCADRSDVKVLNMSLGGPPSNETFNALSYAVNIKGKLVAAAAGNSSTYNFSFPGAWASQYVCADGTDTYPFDCGTNTIDQAVLSVGAARPSFSDSFDANADGYLWVDTDGDGLEPADTDPDFWDEHFYPDQCASYFSNYGQWVEIVAPGEDILSSLPVTYPFHDQFYFGSDPDNDGYEWYSGTSMATPHVAAGAARAWSLSPASTNAAIEDLLLATGDQFDMAFAHDPNIADPAEGYFDTGYLGEAPYCWPDALPGDPFSDTSNAVYLNVAAAMNRGALWVGVYDALTGLPLPGATVKAFLGASLKDQTKAVSEYDDYLPLLNLPGGSIMDVKINKSGYTAGDVWIAWHTTTAGYFSWGPWLEVGVPPNNKRIHAVLNWDGYWDDLDFFAWTPASAGFVVGPWDPGSGAIYIDYGDFMTPPFARWNRDGGFGDWFASESISIQPKSGSTTTPYYNVTAGDYYDFLVTDIWQPGLLNEYIILRIWANGTIVGVTEKGSMCDTDGANNVNDVDYNTMTSGDDEIWWHAGYINGSAFTSTDFCGIGDTWTNDPNGAWPYRVDRVTGGIPEEQGGK